MNPPMYGPIFESQRCIGYVEADVYANHLMDALLNPNAEFVF